MYFWQSWRVGLTRIMQINEIHGSHVYVDSLTANKMIFNVLNSCPECA